MFTNTRSLFFVVLVLWFCNIAEAQILPSTDSVFFKNVKVGFTRDAFLTIEALSDITITDIKITPRVSLPGEFILITPTQLSFSLVKGDRRNFILRCKPSLGGDRTAFMTILTTAGEVQIELVGEVASKQPDVITEPDTLDFGVIAPNEVKEIPYKIYGAGIDSAIITDLFVANDNGPSVYFEIYAIDASVVFPHTLGPTDTLHMMARFTGYDPVGIKRGRSDLAGDVSGSTTCEFRGAVGKPEMQFSPQLLDLGIVPLGATVDTFIHLRSIGEGAVTIESITPPASYTITGIPKLPHDIDQSDSLKLNVQFTALAQGVYEQALEAVAKATALGGRYRSALIKAIVLPNQLLVQQPEVLEVPCGIEATYQFSPLRLSDTSTLSVNVSRIVSDNPDVIVVDSALFPMSIGPGENISVRLDHSHRNASDADSAIIAVYSGNYVLLRDTVRIKRIEQFIRLDAQIVDQELQIVAQNDIAPFKVNQLIINIAVDHTDVVSLLLSSLLTHPSLSAAVVTPSFDTVAGLYRIEIVSPNTIDLLAGDLVATIPLQHFYAKDSTAALTASAVVPQFSPGCVTFTPVTTVTTTPDDCNEAILRRQLGGERLISGVALSENPILDGNAGLHFSLLASAQASLAVYDRLGSLVLQDHKTGLAAGRNQIALPAGSFAAGSYTAVLTARNAYGYETVSVSFIVTR